MKRIAFFVEGQTEQIFVNRLIKEILGTQRTNIIQKKGKGGASVPKQEIVRNQSLSRDPWYEILIYDCGADNRVKSEILDNLENLNSLGYDKIIGLRDLYPLPTEELDRLKKGLTYLPRYLRNREIDFDVIVAVQEIETWFLAETNHLQRIDHRLTGKFIKRHLGFNPYTDNPMLRMHPAADLNNIYKLVDKAYNKRYTSTKKTVNKLDYHNIFNNLCHEITSLGDLIHIIRSIKRVEHKKKKKVKR